MYTKPLEKNYETIKIIYDQNDEIWRIDLADFSDYET